MNAPGTAMSDLVFAWDKPGRGKWTLTGFLLGSLALHAFGFYLFQIVYPPAVALLPPPGRVSLIAPDTDEGRQLLRWLEAEDPALASTTQPAPDAKALVLPTIQHAPSYLARQSALKDLPPAPPALRIPSAHPPSPVEKPSAASQFTTKPVPTVIRFSPELDSLITPQTPELKFNASSRESPEPARFLVAVNEKGEVRHCFLQSSSGDAALDDQARKYLALTRFLAIRNSPTSNVPSLIWGTATLEWGNDLAFPPAPNPAPSTP
jgi:outer membrane biosynthesis protein TonB